MKIKSFGCSFIYGSELPLTDKTSNVCFSRLKFSDLSNQSWPLLIADHYQLPFENYATPGIGNLIILERILAQAELVDPGFFIINWTWIDRVDFINPLTENWDTLRPSGNTQAHLTYYKHFYNQYHTMLTNASYILTAINVLNSKNIPFCMTLIDPMLFDPIDPNWQDPYALRMLQNSIRPYITWFDNMDFLSWSRKNNYSVSETWHPLTEAHSAAAKYMINFFDNQKINVLAQ
jgi:hypothetical protein